MIAVVSATLVVLLAVNRSLASWWLGFTSAVYERKTRGTLHHRSMTPTVLTLLFAMTGHAMAEGEPIIVELHAPAWCKPCQKLAPKIARLKAEGYAIQQVDVDGKDEAIATPGQVAKQPGLRWVSAFKPGQEIQIPALVVIDPATFKHTTTESCGDMTLEQLRAFVQKAGMKPHLKR